MPISACIASSKLNGWSETGLAFGMMEPPMTNAVEHSSLRTSSEHVSAGACSASCYNRTEQVRFFAVVMTERELGQVQRQIGLADLVIGADHSTLEQAPKAIQVRGMDVSAHIFTLGMAHRFVRESNLIQLSVAAIVIGRHQRDISINRLLHEGSQRVRIHGFNNLRDHVSFSSNGPNDGDFSASRSSRTPAFLVPVPVLILAAEICFVHFDFAHELSEPAVLHRRPDAMAHIPGRPIVAAADLAMDLQGADPLLALRHQINDLEPNRQGIVGVLENGLADDREAVTVPATTFFAFADPVKRLALQSVDFLIRATRALYAVRPAFLGEKLLAGFFGGEACHQCAECHAWLSHRALRCWRNYSPPRHVVSSAT